MRPASTIVSLGSHVALALAVLLGSAKARPTMMVASSPPPLIFPPSDHESGDNGFSVPGPVLTGDVSPPPIEVPVILADPAPSSPPFSPTAGTDTTTGRTGGRWMNPIEERPQALAGPLPKYPELLRQAGIEGRVVFAAVVDTAGRIEPGTLTLVFATHPGFVASARQALLGTLFRPARVGGRAVRVQVRLPIEFTLRNHTPGVR